MSAQVSKPIDGHTVGVRSPIQGQDVCKKRNAKKKTGSLGVMVSGLLALFIRGYSSVQFDILKSEFGRSQLISPDSGCLEICCVSSNLRFCASPEQSS